MKYYRRFPGDYLRDTVHLSLAEDGAYTRLLDKLYSSEKPLPLDSEVLYSMVRARSKADKAAVDSILRQFFTKNRKGFENKRGKNEIKRTKKISAIRSDVAKQRGKKQNDSAIAEQLNLKHDTVLHTKPEARSQTPDTQDHLSVGIAAEETTAAAFTALGYDQPFGPAEFRASWVREYAATTNGDFTDAMERTAKFCQSQHIKIPKLFFTLKRKVEELEIENRFRRTPL